jgi:hypothetical protein
VPTVYRRPSLSMVGTLRFAHPMYYVLPWT